jgi:chromosome segregation ATPase
MQNNLKSLQTRKNSLQSDIDDLEKERNEINRRIKDKRNSLLQINNNIKQLQANVIVTEHAKLRYLERVKGINMVELEKEILGENLREQIKILGSGRFNMNGYRLIVKNNSIITVEKESKC